MQSLLLARSLIEKSDWLNAICNCEDIFVKRWALYACAQVVLPCWESRFQRDESMASLVDCIAKLVKNPSPENVANLESSIPKRVRRNWDLSPPPGVFDERFSDCPADFAGDSIFYSACACINEPDEYFAFGNAKECFARLFVERDANYEDDTDYQGMADRHLRSAILETLSKEFA